MVFKTKTERVVVEDDWSLDESRVLSLVARHMENLVILTGPKEDILWVNDSFERITGFSFEEARGQRPGILLQGAETDSETVGKIREAVAHGLGFYAEIINYTKQKNPYWIAINAQPIFNSNGEIIHFFAVENVITERKEYESRLLKSEQIFSKAFHFSGVGKALSSIDGTILEINNTLCDMLGYTHSELTFRGIDEITHPDDVEKNSELLRRSFRGEMDHYTLEKRYLHKNGSFIWVILDVSLVRNVDGSPAFLISEVQDITTSKLLQEQIILQKNQLEETARRLTKRNQQLEEFNQIVSHNLRAPVGNIITLLELHDFSKDSAEKNDYLQLLRETGQLLSSTLDEIIEVLRVRQSPDIERKNLRFEEVLQKVMRMLAAEISAVDAEVIYDFRQCEYVDFPPVYLESIFLNLLSNSIKYRNQDRLLKITYQTELDDRTVILRATDNGMGIDMEKYGHQVFKLHKTFHRSPEAKGIGLYMTRNQIETMGGEIDLYSKVNEGATFLVRFKR
jgi:PAS domain S-box-containing protein